MTPTFFKKRMLASAATALALSLAWSTADAQIQDYDIEAQALGTALLEFGKQSGVNVAAPRNLVEGKTAPAIRGEMEPQEALDLILLDSGLKSTKLPTGAYTITLGMAQTMGPVRVAQVDTGAVRSVGIDDLDIDEEEEKEPDEIVVTGTSIAGVYPNAVPLEVFDAAEIEAMGAVSVEDLFTRIPQNLSDFTTTAPFAVNGRGGSANKVNLRGLGTGATLTLINGRRLVSPGGSGPDISLIPLAAVDRVEILSDGASAVYGSDAIGGVVNIILRDNADGAETFVSYGTVTDGGHRRLKAEQSLGYGWRGGNMLAGYSFSDTTDLDVSERDFSSAASSPFNLIPPDQRHSALLSINQELSNRVRLGGDLLYARRSSVRTATRQVLEEQLWRLDSVSEQLFATITASIDLTDKLNLEVAGAYSEAWGQGETTVDGAFRSDSNSNSSYADISGKVDGDLFELPAGPVKFAVGGSYAKDKYFSASAARRESDRSNRAVFSEVLVPIFGEKNRISGFEVLELNLAARYSDYSDFGGKISPRFGLFWKPIESLGLRGTYSQGFRAPSTAIAAEGLGGGFNILISPSLFGFPDPFSNDGSTVYLWLQDGTNPGLGPETSESFTLGFDFEPAFLPGARISATYYNISYADRISEPDTSGGIGAILDPDSFPSLFTVNPSLDLLEEFGGNDGLNLLPAPVDVSDPVSLASVVTVLLDNRIANIAEFDTEGIDFAIDYTTGTSFGDLTFGSRLTYVINSVSLPVPGVPPTERLNTVGQQSDFRGSAFIGLTRGGFRGQVNLRYVDGYMNTFVTPEESVDSWSTIDVTTSYDFAAHENWALKGLVLSLSVTNLFDQDPPFVENGFAGFAAPGLQESVGFDPANASPVGRFVQIGIRKKF